MTEKEGTDLRDIRIGSLALRAGLVTPEQIREALAIQASEAMSGRMPRQVGLILIAKGWLQPDQLAALLQQQESFRQRPT